MIPVTQSWLNAINAPSRHIVAKLEIYFDATPIVLYEDDIMNIKLLEEDSAESANPLGSVSSNSLDITINNVNRYFTPSNTQSPYYGKLKPNVVVKPFISVKEAGDWVYAALGTFSTGDWYAPSNQVSASIDCFDRLRVDGEKMVTGIRVLRNTTLANLFRLAFISVGLTDADFDIDQTLDSVLPISWLKRDKLRNVLQELARSGPARVYVGRDGKIKVKKLILSGAAVQQLTDDNQIYNITFPTIYRNTYSTISTKKHAPFLQQPKTVSTLYDVDVPPEGLVLTNISFANGPVAIVERIAVIGSDEVVVADSSFDAWSLTVNLANNSLTAKVVQLEVSAWVVESNSTEHVTSNGLDGKDLQVDSIYLQDTTQYNNTLLTLLSDPQSKINLTTRGNPALELNDIIEVVSASDNVPLTKVLITRSELDYTGGLKGKIQGIKI